ncbi:MAG: homoserine kinase [Alphaproteobacteria bacterium]|nr:homoserine kinase [Alphaproteobacteria bacterium]
MAVYTHIEDDELAALLARYDIGELLSFAGIAEGVENSNYLVRTTKAHYILTLYEKRVDEADLPFFIGLMEHLSAKGLQCPVPIKDKTGAILQICAGRTAAMVSFLDGTSHRFPNREKCAALGSALAHFHIKSDDFTIMRHNALGPESWAPLLASITGEIPDLPQDIREKAASQLTDILAKWPKSLPRGFIHADLFPNNALFVRDKLTGIIDFYFGCHDILAYDIAVILNSWCFDADGSFNVTKSSTILSAYQEQRPLSDAEKQALPLLCKGAAMRFFLTRLYDWINTPADAMVKPLNPMEYYAKLRFHDTAPGPEAYGLWS